MLAFDICLPLYGTILLMSLHIVQGSVLSVYRNLFSGYHNGPFQEFSFVNRFENRIDVIQGKRLDKGFEINLAIEAIDRTGLLKDITSILSDLKVNALSLQMSVNKETQTADIQIMMEIKDLEQLQKVTDKIMQLPNVLKVYRQNL